MTEENTSPVGDTGWGVTGPDPAVTDAVANELSRDGVMDDILGGAYVRAALDFALHGGDEIHFPDQTLTIRDGVVYFGPVRPAPTQDRIREMFMDTIREQEETIHGQDRDRHRAQWLGNWSEDIKAWEKHAEDKPVLYGGRLPSDPRVHYWTTDPTRYGHTAVVKADGSLHHYRDPPAGVAAIAARWIRERRWTTPGWSGTLADRSPLTAPIRMHYTPGMILGDGHHHPNARRMTLRGGRWMDDGPAWEPNPDARPAYRLPIPWDNPLADPLADLRAAGGGTVYGEHRHE